MGNVLGSLFVELGVNTAAFASGLSKATYSLKKGAEQMGDSFESVGESIARIGSKFGEFGNIAGEALSTITNKLGSVISGLGEVEGLGGGLKAGGLGFLALGAGALVAGSAVVGIAIHTAEAAKHLYDLVAATGLSVSTLSGLAAVAKLSEVDIDTLAKGLERMNRMAAQSALAPQANTNAFRQLGIQVTDTNGKLKSTETIFTEVAEKFSKMEDGSTKSALAMQIFGRGGAQLIAVLNRGGESMQYWINYATKVGAVLTDDAAKGADAFNERLDQLGLISTGVQNKLMVALLPAIDHIVESLTTFLEKGDKIQHFGEIVGKVLVAITKLVYETSFAWDYWGNKLDAWKAKAHGFLANHEKIGMALEAAHVIPGGSTIGAQVEKMTGVDFDKQAKDAEDRIQKARDRLAMVMADLESKSVTPPAPEAKGKKVAAPTLTQGLVAATGVTDYVGGLIGKSKAATVAQLALAQAIGETSAALLVQKATAAADIAIGNTRVQIMNSIKGLEIQQNEQMRVGAKNRADALGREIGMLGRQLVALDASKAKIEALYDTKAVADFVSATNKAFAEQNEKLTEQVAAQQAVADAAQKGGEVAVAANIEDKLTSDKVKVDQLRDAYNALSQVQGVDRDQLSVLAVAISRASAEVEKHRALLQQEYNISIQTAEAKYNLTARYNDETLKLQQMTAVAEKNNDVMAQMLLKAEKQNVANSFIQQWDKAALQVGTFSDKFKAMLNELAISNQNVGQKIFGSITKAVDGLAGQFASLVTTGKSNFKQLFSSLEEEILKVLFSKALTSLLSKLAGVFGLGGDGSGMNQGGGFFGALFGGGGKAEGGSVTPGVGYLVGERGPERFVPDVAGKIIPSGESAGGGAQGNTMNASIAVHVHGAKDVDSFRRAGPQIAAQMYRQMQMAHAHNGGNG